MNNLEEGGETKVIIRGFVLSFINIYPESPLLLLRSKPKLTKKNSILVNKDSVAIFFSKLLNDFIFIY